MTVTELLRRPAESIDDIDALFRSPPATLGISISSQSARIGLHHLWRNLQTQLGTMSPELAAELDALGQLEPAEILDLKGSRPTYFLAYLTLARKANPQL